MDQGPGIVGHNRNKRVLSSSCYRRVHHAAARMVFQWVFQWLDAVRPVGCLARSMGQCSSVAYQQWWGPGSHFCHDSDSQISYALLVWQTLPLHLASSASVRVLDAVEQQCDRHRRGSVSDVDRSLAVAVREGRRTSSSVCGEGAVDSGSLGARRCGVVAC
jgi:hypothetical protein